MFAAGKFSGKEGKDWLRHRWDALALELNSIGGGAQKDSSQWQTVSILTASIFGVPQILGGF